MTSGPIPPGAIPKIKGGMTMINQKTMTLKLKRIDVCDLMLACTIIGQGTDAKKWGKLHDMLKVQLDAFDEKEVQQ